MDPAEFTPVAPQIMRLREAIAAKETTVEAAEQEIEAAVEGMRLGDFSWE